MPKVVQNHAWDCDQRRGQRHQRRGKRDEDERAKGAPEAAEAEAKTEPRRLLGESIVQHRASCVIIAGSALHRDLAAVASGRGVDEDEDSSEDSEVAFGGGGGGGGGTGAALSATALAWPSRTLYCTWSLSAWLVRYSVCAWM